MKYIVAFLFLLSCTSSFAQSNKFFDSTNNITVEFVDAPIRTALEQLLKQGNVKNFAISNDVEGFVSMKLQDQKLESALKILLRANKYPLLYKIENEVLIIERRRETIFISDKPDISTKEELNSTWQIIPLNFIDPLDLQIVFGPILNMRQFTRYGNFMGNQNFMNNQNNMNGNNQRNNNR